jgi:hypothetical protein
VCFDPADGLRRVHGQRAPVLGDVARVMIGIARSHGLTALALGMAKRVYARSFGSYWLLASMERALTRCAQRRIAVGRDEALVLGALATEVVREVRRNQIRVERRARRRIAFRRDG